MSGFPGGSCSVTPPALGQAGSNDCRFELPDLGRDGPLPFRFDLSGSFSFLVICLFPFFLSNERSVSTLHRSLSSRPGLKESAGRSNVKAPSENSSR